MRDGVRPITNRLIDGAPDLLRVGARDINDGDRPFATGLSRPDIHGRNAERGRFDEARR